MPDVNLQYLLAVALIDGSVSFDASHSYERMRDTRVLAAKARVQLVAVVTKQDGHRGVQARSSFAPRAEGAGVLLCVELALLRTKERRT